MKPASAPFPRRPVLATLVLAPALLGAAPALAQMIVVGNGMGSRCYEHAVTGNGSVEAVSDCTAALAGGLSRRDTGATYVNRAIIYIYRENWEDALEDVEDSTRYRVFPETYATRSVVYFHTGRLEEAVEQATLALADEDLRVPAKVYYNRARANEDLGRIEAAYDDYRAAAEADPRWRLPREELTRFRVVSGGADASS